MYAALLDSPVDTATAAQLNELFADVDPKLRNGEAIAMAMIGKALKGDTAAAKYIAEVVGERRQPPPAAEITVKVVE